MTLATILITLQVAISILLAILILLQQRGAGLGSLAGGSDGGFHSERRGAEKLIFQATIVLAVAFCLNAFLIPVLT